MPKQDDQPEKVPAKPVSVKKTTRPAAKAEAEADRPKAKPVDVTPAAAIPTKTAAPSAKAGGGGEAAAASADRNYKGLAIKVGAVIVALLVVVLVVFGVLIYAYKSENPAVKAVAQVVPYPAERVNGRFVTYNDYLFEVDANKRAYVNNAKLNNQQQPDFNSADGKKLVTQIKQHALDKLKSDALVAQLADEKHVKVSDKEVNDLINQLYQRYGGKDTLLKTLNQIYGWNLNDLRKVVYKQLLARDLETKVTADPAVDAAAKQKAQDVLSKVKGGGDFTALAKQYSQASDAASGGDLGFFTKGQLPDNEQTAAEALQPGQVSDVIKTQYGYEILKVLEKKDDGSIHAQHILIKTIDFNSWFQTKLNQAKTNTYIKA